jgi:riboflavin biosynthesis pyrimidine reductase
MLCNFALTVDGRAAIDGRSGPIAGPADLELLLALRSRVDAVMVGAGTLRAERYGRIIRDPDVRARREAEGLSDDPLAVVVSGSLEIPWEIPLFSDGGGEVVVFTSSEEGVPETETATRMGSISRLQWPTYATSTVWPASCARVGRGCMETSGEQGSWMNSS